jgi:6-phosphogluconate dehydrogenase
MFILLARLLRHAGIHPKGVKHGIRYRRTRPHGRQHGAAAGAQGHQDRAHNRSHDVSEAIAAETGHLACATLPDLVAALQAPRIVWLMLPAGEATEAALTTLLPLLSPGDLVVDGANAYYKDDAAPRRALAAKQIEFADAGVSGGVWGLDNGYCIMFGGSDAAAARLKPYMEALAPTPTTGWLHTGPVGSGHFVKMVHNGIEYGMMQAFAEGFALMKGQAGLRSRSRRDCRAVAARQRGALLAAGSVGGFSGAGPGARIHRAVRRRFRRRPLDRACLGRAGRPDAGDDACADDAFRHPGQERLRGKMLAKMRQGFGGHAVKEG